MTYIKILNYEEPIPLKREIEESTSGTGIWYLTLNVNKNFSSEEIMNLFVPANLSTITYIDSQGEEEYLYGYTNLISARKFYPAEGKEFNYWSLTLEKIVIPE